MSDRYSLTEQEQEAIARHARRRSAYLSLKRLVDQWRVELALQERADRVVARACGVIAGVLLLAAAGWWLAF